MNGVGGEGQRLSQILFGLCSVDFWLLFTLSECWAPLIWCVSEPSLLAALQTKCWSATLNILTLKLEIIFPRTKLLYCIWRFVYGCRHAWSFQKKGFLLQLCNEPRSKASVHQIKALNILSDPARATDRSWHQTWSKNLYTKNI